MCKKPMKKFGFLENIFEECSSGAADETFKIRKSYEFILSLLVIISWYDRSVIAKK